MERFGPLLRPFPGSRPDAFKQLNQRQEEDLRWTR
jgi:hypothetical protein